MTRDISIVGGGIGGLVTALLLSQDTENRITIYEKQQTMGGRLSFIYEGEDRIDQGPTIILLPDMLLSILNEGGISREKLPIVPCDPLYSIEHENGKRMYKYRDIQKQREEIERLFPGEGEGFDRFIRDMKWRYALGEKQFLKQQFINKKDFFSRKNLHSLVKMKAYLHVKRLLKQYFKSEELQNIYALQTLYIGGNPGESPALYSLVSYSEHEHGIWYLKGGYASLVDIIVKELEKRNVSMVNGAKVEEVVVQQKHCEGVKVNGEFVPYDDVIMNGDFPIMDQLMPVENKLNRTYTPSSGCFLLYMGLDKNYEQPSIHRFFMGKDFDSHMRDVFQHKRLPENPSIYTFHPSLIDHSLAKDSEGILYTLVPVPSGEQIDWSQKEEYADYILELLEERGYPNLRNHLTWLKIKTPQEAMQEGLYSGGSFGIAPTLFQSGAFRPQLKPYDVDNIYAVGASIHPGGGVPIVMQGAKLLADYLMEQNSAILQHK
ncbi:phytoene desaturase family protein [Pontibacillus yanchengensis]|uniref:Capsular biosynthesis protein CpsH n=1 Tax=Pontibacillus yanchengensis Y32 TaxID=1385514 RepID=A0A0A2TCR3_9BACI|nr:phytoene desaturase family protein [Pontibacillus yanchengensis]KGP72218.1 capsular biosynthesis protein CpsH [Pontibacillus yanchengensis Y32]